MSILSLISYLKCTDIILRVEHTNFLDKLKGKYEKHEKL